MRLRLVVWQRCSSRAQQLSAGMPSACSWGIDDNCRFFFPKWLVVFVGNVAVGCVRGWCVDSFLFWFGNLRDLGLFFNFYFLFMFKLYILFNFKYNPIGSDLIRIKSDRIAKFLSDRIERSIRIRFEHIRISSDRSDWLESDPMPTPRFYVPWFQAFQCLELSCYIIAFNQCSNFTC